MMLRFYTYLNPDNRLKLSMILLWHASDIMDSLCIIWDKTGRSMLQFCQIQCRSLCRLKVV